MNFGKGASAVYSKGEVNSVVNSENTMDGLPVLRTQRLRLYIPGPEAAEECVRFNRENAEFLRIWEPRTDTAAYDPTAVRVARERAVEAALEGSAYSFAIVKADADSSNAPIIGWLTFSNIVRGVFQATYLGYKLAEDAQHHGYMTEAAQAGVQFAFDTLRLHRIMANYMPQNHRSGAALDRLGFEREGYAKDYLCINGKWQDHILTSLVNPESDPPWSG